MTGSATVSFLWTLLCTFQFFLKHSWVQKKEPLIPSFRQVGHWSRASRLQPGVSQRAPVDIVFKQISTLYDMAHSQFQSCTLQYNRLQFLTVLNNGSYDATTSILLKIIFQKSVIRAIKIFLIKKKTGWGEGINKWRFYFLFVKLWSTVHSSLQICLLLLSVVTSLWPAIILLNSRKMTKQGQMDLELKKVVLVIKFLWLYSMHFSFSIGICWTTTENGWDISEA